VLRVEDTDRERSTEESVQAIFDGMQWLGIDFDDGPYFQTERYDLYNQLIDKLVEAGHAYPCYCSRARLDKLREDQQAQKLKPRYDGHCREGATPVTGVTPVIRFKTPLDGTVVIDDLVKGNIEIDNRELDDLIIRRSDGNPTYNLTVVADDIDMDITHVIRGDDHINNTPRQIHIFNALGAALPRFAHLPMILGEDGKRMSKRHGAVSVTQYKQDGILPQAMLNYLARLGWSHGDQEIFSIEELKSLFELTDCNRSGSVFDKTKLLWVNEQHMAALPEDRLGQGLADALTSSGVDMSVGPAPAVLAAVLKDRAQTFADMAGQAKIFYTESVEFDEKAAKKQLRPVTMPVLRALKEKLTLQDTWQAKELKQALEELAEQLEVGFGKIGQPLRVALTGSGASPDIADTLALIGKDKSLSRIDVAIDYVAAREAAS